MENLGGILDSAHSPGFLEKYGVVGSVQVYRPLPKAALRHEVSTMKCICLEFEFISPQKFLSKNINMPGACSRTKFLNQSITI